MLYQPLAGIHNWIFPPASGHCFCETVDNNEQHNGREQIQHFGTHLYTKENWPTFWNQFVPQHPNTPIVQWKPAIGRSAETIHYYTFNVSAPIFTIGLTWRRHSKSSSHYSVSLASDWMAQNLPHTCCGVVWWPDEDITIQYNTIQSTIIQLMSCNQFRPVETL